MKISIVGTGMIATEVISLLKTEVKGIETTSIFSHSNEEKAELLAKMNHIGRIYTDYAQLLKEDKADFVYIALVNNAHYEFTRMALEAGRNVIVEKPFTLTVAEAEELAASIEGSFIPAQFDNQANPAVHKATTGPEIWNDTEGEVDIFISGIGTGGTISGVGEFLKEKKPNVKVIAVEPTGSPILSEGKSGPHKIQGIGAGFIPNTLNTKIYDEIITVENEEAFEYGRLIASKEGILVGISSGAALFAAIEEAKKPENEGKTIVALLPDSGDRYFSTPLFTE